MSRGLGDVYKRQRYNRPSKKSRRLCPALYISDISTKETLRRFQSFACLRRILPQGFLSCHTVLSAKRKLSPTVFQMPAFPLLKNAPLTPRHTLRTAHTRKAKPAMCVIFFFFTSIRYFPNIRVFLRRYFYSAPASARNFLSDCIACVKNFPSLKSAYVLTGDGTFLAASLLVTCMTLSGILCSFATSSILGTQ